LTAGGIRIASIGVLCAYGLGTDALAAGLRAGSCPVSPASGIGFPADAPPLVSRFDAARYPRGEAGAAAALLEVVEHAAGRYAGGIHAIAASDCALIVGTGGFLYASGAELYGRATGTIPADTPFRVRGPGWGAELIAERYAMRGPRATLSTGCSSSANALLLAIEMLQREQVRRALVVGAEGLSAVTLSGFDALMLLAPDGCRPFDRDRGGLQLGEGIAALVLERDDTAHAALTLLGGANACDTHHLTSASPDGAVMREVMREALGSAGIAHESIVAVKAHGTGSADSDAAEANALRGTFVRAMPPLTALKRYLGHTLGACGTLELVALAACLERGFVPAAAGFRTRDPELGIEPLREAIDAPRGHYLLNFFGFGGNYTSLVVRHA
jgi:3-oxoacyl-[acyl-carrier-protein] synthase-1